LGWKDQLGPHAEEIAMTIAEQWHEEGRQEGREEGIAKGFEEGRIAALLTLLRSKFGVQARDAAIAAHLRAATPAALEHYLELVLVADKLAAVFQD
jgi:flagellar biosynthesis/type III secretory pathway protein FliH